ncbi:MAG: tyrosine--tRNA ligase [Rickettsiales bacterium]|nr:tyrosine--tRNA ligase [Rickettsiales bacterium]
MSNNHPLLNELKARGFIYQTTNLDALNNTLDKSATPAGYIGFDCTATSLHVGNLLQIMLLRLLQKYSIKPIVIIGGGTSKVGDPSGRDTAREVLSEDMIQKNLLGIKKSLKKFLKFDEEKQEALLLNNQTWLEDLNYIKFLRDYGTLFSVNKMLSFEKVKLRLKKEQNLSFLEFNYPILQSYDFLHLAKNYNCILQFGGSDQWGNIVFGVELTKKVIGKEVFGITTPLITTASGTKMGKSQEGALWLNEDLLSPYDYYQFWRNTDDRDVFRFMKIYTDLSLDQITKYENDKDTNINDFKKILAYEATKICHGEENAKQTSEKATKIFEQGDTTQLPEFKISKEKISTGIPIYTIFKEAGLTQSNGEAKRLIKGGGAKLNKTPIKDENYNLTSKDFKDDYALLSSGKKKHIKLTLSSYEN